MSYPFYHAPRTLAEALALKATYGAEARAIAGGTDLLLEMERGVRKNSAGGAPGLIDLSHIPGLADIALRTGVDGRPWIHLGCLVTHNQCVASSLIVQQAFPLARACWEVGAPQIRNRATVVGNLVTASPANDTIAPLLAMDAVVTVASAARGERTVALADFILGFRKVDLTSDELVVDIAFPALSAGQQGLFIKLGLRRAQAISVVSLAVLIECAGDCTEAPVTRAAIALGSVAPVVVRATAAERFLTGKILTEDVIAEAARLAVGSASPIDDVRATAGYRRAMVASLTARALHQIVAGESRAGWPEKPVLLWGAGDGRWPAKSATSLGAAATVNGCTATLPTGMTLLDGLRHAGFTGVKEGCAEGECGACTVFLDGLAVMACMVPVERAIGSAVVTVEGLGQPGALHPVQQALVDSGGVQCGYCTPGFVMSAAKLLEERPHPTVGEAQEALTGNFCRCTGYRKILDAVVAAGTLV